MKNMTLRLNDERAATLELVAWVENKTVTDTVRTAIDEHIEARGKDKAFMNRLKKPRSKSASCSSGSLSRSCGSPALSVRRVAGGGRARQRGARPLMARAVRRLDRASLRAAAAVSAPRALGGGRAASLHRRSTAPR